MSTRAKQFGQKPVWRVMRRGREWCAHKRVWALAWFSFLSGLVESLWSVVSSMSDRGSL